MNRPVQPSTASGHDGQPANPVREAVSAWMDGELDDADVAAHWADTASQDERAQSWHRYHLIGDVLRSSGAAGGFTCSDSARVTRDALAFARSVTRLAAVDQVGSADWAPQPAVLPQAPTVSQVATPAVQTVPPATPKVAQAAAPANDAVFRWKLVAGLASVAAVTAVAWTVSGWSAGGAAQYAAAPIAVGSPAVVQVADGGPSADTLAAARNAALAQAASPVVAVSGDNVWVSTPQGLVLRDARLDELMRAHRQAGGAAALTGSAGFLRAATSDVAASR